MEVVWASSVGSFESIASSLRSVFVVLISDFKYLLLAPISPHHGNTGTVLLSISGKEAIFYVRGMTEKGAALYRSVENALRMPVIFPCLSELDSEIFALGAIAGSWPNAETRIA